MFQVIGILLVLILLTDFVMNGGGIAKSIWAGVKAIVAKIKGE